MESRLGPPKESTWENGRSKVFFFFFRIELHLFHNLFTYKISSASIHFEIAFRLSRYVSSCVYIKGERGGRHIELRNSNTVSCLLVYLIFSLSNETSRYSIILHAIQTEEIFRLHGYLSSR